MIAGIGDLEMVYNSFEDKGIYDRMVFLRGTKITDCEIPI